VTTLVAAFIGALVGSIGSILVEELLRRRREQHEQREALVRGFLFPLQDAVEALWHRLYNIGYEGGRGAMTPGYLQATTVYALGRVLATERMLSEEGVYPILQRREFYPELAQTLAERRLSVELDIPGLRQYDRIALAETVLERDERGTRPSTYLAFRNRYGDGGAGSAEWLTSAAQAVGDLRAWKMDELLDLLGLIAHQAAAATRMVPSIVAKERARDWIRSAEASEYEGQWVLLDKDFSVLDSDSSLSALLPRNPEVGPASAVYVQPRDQSQNIASQSNRASGDS
jgi:hypothetical protein